MNEYEAKNTNSNEYNEWLCAVIKDMERIKLYLSGFEIENKNLFNKLQFFKDILIQKQNSKSEFYMHDIIAMNDDYVAIKGFNSENNIEINDRIDCITGTEYTILINKNIKEFYFFDRKTVYEIEEGIFVIKKLEANWNKEKFIIKDRMVIDEKVDLELDELIEEKIYKKGRKK